MATGRRRGGRTLILVLFIVLLLVLVLFAFFKFGMGGLTGGGNQSQAPATGQVVPTFTPVPENMSIVVTSGDVKRGQELTDDKLMLAEIPTVQYNEAEFFTTKEEVLGARALFDLKGQTAVKKSMIVGMGEAAIPSFEIPKGKVAISIPVSRLSTVSYGLQKGDHVNVLTSLMLIDVDTTFQTRLPNRTGWVVGAGPLKADVQTSLTATEYHSPEYTTSGNSALSWAGRVEVDPTLGQPIFMVPSEQQRPRMVSQTLIQDAVILQMDNFDQAASGGSSQGSLTAPTTEQPTPAAAAPVAAAPAGQATPAAAPAVHLPEVATLIVDPQDAVTLNYLMLSGANLNMVLRSAGDDSKIETEAVTLQFILDQYRIPNPAKLPYALEPRKDDFPTNISSFPAAGPTPTPVPAQ